MLKPPPASDTTAQRLPAGNESLIISSSATGNSVRVIRGELKKNEDGEDIMDGTKRYRYIGLFRVVKVEEGQWKAVHPIYRSKLIQIPEPEAEANRMNMEVDSPQAQESAR